jgi:hypothetical protein
MLHHSASAHVWLMSKFEVDTLPFLNLSINLVTPKMLMSASNFHLKARVCKKKNQIPKVTNWNGKYSSKHYSRDSLLCSVESVSKIQK